jgi:hypothetical protein
LRAFVPAAQQHNQNRSALDVIDPIARPAVNAQFADAFTGRTCIAGIAESQTANPGAILARDCESRSAFSQAEKVTVSRISIT